MEKWITLFEGFYRVSNLGRIRSIGRYVKTKGNGKQWRLGKILKPRMNRYGYLQLCLSIRGNVKTYTIHRLVTQEFIPNPENKPCVNHKNNDRTDNCVENLEWCTHKENEEHKVSCDRQAKGEKNGTAKLTNIDIRFIRHLKDDFNLKQRDISKVMGYVGKRVCQRTINTILNGITWKHVK